MPELWWGTVSQQETSAVLSMMEKFAQQGSWDELMESQRKILCHLFSRGVLPLAYRIGKIGEEHWHSIEFDEVVLDRDRYRPKPIILFTECDIAIHDRTYRLDLGRINFLRRSIDVFDLSSLSTDNHKAFKEVCLAELRRLTNWPIRRVRMNYVGRMERCRMVVRKLFAPVKRTFLPEAVESMGRSIDETIPAIYNHIELHPGILLQQLRQQFAGIDQFRFKRCFDLLLKSTYVYPIVSEQKTVYIASPLYQ